SANVITPSGTVIPACDTAKSRKVMPSRTTSTRMNVSIDRSASADSLTCVSAEDRRCQERDYSHQRREGPNEMEYDQAMAQRDPIGGHRRPKPHSNPIFSGHFDQY